MSDFFAVAVAAIITIIPFYVGVLVSLPVLRGHPKGAVAVALGASFYFFLDPIRDTNGLGGFSPNPGTENLILVAAFALAFLALSFGKGNAEAWPVWIVAFGIAIHSFAEAAVLPGTVPDYLNNFSTAYLSSIAFTLHKFLEGLVFAAYCLAAGARTRQALVGGAPLVVISIAGVLSSFLPTIDLTPVIAAGAGGWLFVTVVLAFRVRGTENFRSMALVFVGFIIVYSVGLLHST